jgi:hypothetical protein
MGGVVGERLVKAKVADLSLVVACCTFFVQKIAQLVVVWVRAHAAGLVVVPRYKNFAIF